MESKSKKSLVIYPAIDLSGGKVVRLTEGDFARMDVYGDDPVETARGFLAEGATHLHVVDLDGARDGAPRNAGVLSALCRLSGLFIQTGGGIRTKERVAELLDAGISRVILGTAALRDPDFLSAMLSLHGDKIAVGVDAREGKVAVSGWADVSDVDALSFCKRLSAMGVSTVIYTDIGRDGRLSGANLAAYSPLSRLAGLCVIASGGVSGVSDIAALRHLGVHGAIVGKALYAGRLTLREALEAARG